MVNAVGGAGNAWGQIKKVVDPIVAPTAPPPPPPEPAASQPDPTPLAPLAPQITQTPSQPTQPLTYSAGPRQADAAPVAPRATLDARLTAAGYYPVAASPVADPVTQALEGRDAQTQSQVIAQAAYAMVARAETSNREDLIQQG